LTPTYASEEPFLYQHSPTYVLDGAGDSTISAWKVEAGYGLEELQAQAITLDEIAVQNRDINVEMTRRFENATLWKKINMGGGVTPTTSVATGALRADALYGSGAGLRSISLEARLLSYRGLVLSELDPDGRTVMETISAKALKGATHALFGIVKNAHASAYIS
jgi:hypothetical protein